MMKLAIDGSAHSGNYRCDCECSATWQGQGEPITPAAFSPALPVAEAIVHMRLAHNGEPVDIRFSDRFRVWLIAYWDQASRRQHRRLPSPDARGGTRARA